MSEGLGEQSQEGRGERGRKDGGTGGRRKSGRERRERKGWRGKGMRKKKIGRKLGMRGGRQSGRYRGIILSTTRTHHVASRRTKPRVVSVVNVRSQLNRRN